MTNIVSQFNIHQIHEFLLSLERAGLTPELAQKVIESRGNILAENIVAIIRGPQSAFPSYSVYVNYDQTVEEMIQNARYKSNNNITSRNFPSTEKGLMKIDIFLLNFSHSVSRDVAIIAMDEWGFRPATLKELLALGKAYPDLQGQNPIVALGSTWRHPYGDGPMGVPVLTGSKPHRSVNLDWFVDIWITEWRFAAVRI